jgi:hypothetical protein
LIVNLLRNNDFIANTEHGAEVDVKYAFLSKCQRLTPLGTSPTNFKHILATEITDRDSRNLKTHELPSGTKDLAFEAGG